MTVPAYHQSDSNQHYETHDPSSHFNRSLPPIMSSATQFHPSAEIIQLKSMDRWRHSARRSVHQRMDRWHQKAARRAPSTACIFPISDRQPKERSRITYGVQSVPVPQMTGLDGLIISTTKAVWCVRSACGSLCAPSAPTVPAGCPPQ